jgi:hypothetical protein
MIRKRTAASEEARAARQRAILEEEAETRIDTLALALEKFIEWKLSFSWAWRGSIVITKAVRVIEINLMGALREARGMIKYGV